MFEQANRTVLIAAVALAVVIGQGALTAHRVLASKIEQQRTVVDAVMRWRASYEALKPVEARWQATYRDIEGIKDLYTLYRLLDIESSGLQSDADKLVPVKIERVTSNRVDLGLNRICVQIGGADGLVVSAANVGMLLHGLQSLARRQDVRMGDVRLEARGGVPQAMIKDFCALVRDYGGSAS